MLCDSMLDSAPPSASPHLPLPAHCSQAMVGKPRTAWLHLIAALDAALSHQAVEAKASATHSLAGQQVGYFQRLPVALSHLLRLAGLLPCCVAG